MREMYPAGRFEKIRIKLSNEKVHELMVAYIRGECTEDGSNVYDMPVEYLTAHTWVPVTQGFISDRDANPWDGTASNGHNQVFYVEKGRIKYLVINDKRFKVTKRVAQDLIPDIIEYARKAKSRCKR